MPAITFANDAANPSHTIVNVLWSTGEHIQYTIAPNPTFTGADAEVFDDCFPFNVYITGYACPEDGLGFESYAIGQCEVAQQCETEAEAIEFCSDCHC